MTLTGWLILVGLALISHIIGQSLIAFSLAHLAASFSSLTLLIQPVAATVLAWLILDEGLRTQQAIGGNRRLDRDLASAAARCRARNQTMNDRRTSIPLPWLIWGLAAAFYGYGYFQRVAPSVMTAELMREFDAGARRVGEFVGLLLLSIRPHSNPDWDDDRPARRQARVAGVRRTVCCRKLAVCPRADPGLGRNGAAPGRHGRRCPHGSARLRLR